MNRDHFLFLIIGILGGFISGYLVHESMSSRQPAPLWHGAGASDSAQAQGAPSNNASGARPGAVADSGGGQAAMEQVQRLRAYVEENPQDQDATRRLANMNYDIGNWQRAAELYERLLEQSPDDVDGMTDLGACYRNLGQFKEALELFQRARAQQPDHWQAQFNEVLVLAFDMGDLDAAAPVLEELKRLQPNNPDVERLAAELERRKSS